MMQSFSAVLNNFVEPRSWKIIGLFTCLETCASYRSRADCLAQARDKHEYWLRSRGSVLVASVARASTMTRFKAKNILGSNQVTIRDICRDSNGCCQTRRLGTGSGDRGIV